MPQFSPTTSRRRATRRRYSQARRARATCHRLRKQRLRFASGLAAKHAARRCGRLLVACPCREARSRESSTWGAIHATSQAMGVRRILQATTAALCIAGSACGESGWTLDVTVRVPARRQSEYTDYPAQIVLVTDTSAEAIIAGPEGYAVRIANLCSQDSEDFTVQLQLTGDDCAQLPRYVEAWMEPRDPDGDAQCGKLDEPTELVGLRRPSAGSLQAEASVFLEQEQSAGCDGLSDAATLKLDW